MTLRSVNRGSTSAPLTLAFVLASMIALTGCTGGEPTSAPSAAPSSEPTAVSSPEPSPSADLVLGPDGVVGLVPGRAVESEFARLDPEYCRTVYPELEWDDEQSAEWVVSLPGGLSTEDGRDPVEIFAPTDVLELVAVYSPDLRTAGDIGIGSTVDELVAAHPEASVVLEGPLSDVWTLQGDLGTLVFEVPTDARTADYWSADDLGRVRFVRIIAADDEPRPIAGSDGIARCAL